MTDFTPETDANTGSTDSVLPQPSAESAAADLALIASMMQEGRARVQVDGRHLMLWGSLLAVAFVAMYVSVKEILPITQLQIWIVVALIGWSVSLIMGRRAKAVQSSPTSPNPVLNGYAAVWSGMGIVTFLGFVMMFSDADSFQGRQLAIQSCAISGVGFFVTAGLTQLRWLYGVAAAWWAAYVFYGVIGNTGLEILLFQAAYFVAFLLVPGLFLSRGNKPAAASTSPNIGD